MYTEDTRTAVFVKTDKTTDYNGKEVDAATMLYEGHTKTIYVVIGPEEASN